MADESTGKLGDEALLKQIREDYAYHRGYWRENYDESEKDVLCAAAMPPEEFTADRAGRPCIWPDETSQYIKQSNNNWRQNKRSIKVAPRGEANAKDAEHRQAYIRGIEYASKAETIYTSARESCAECAFGYFRVKLRVTGPNGEQEPRLARIPNWSTVFPDPDASEADFSDQMRCFVIDTMRETTFARKYKNAAKRSFSPADRDTAKDWLTGNNITVAEYWVREETKSKDGQITHQVTQYITNGLEILETNQWIGSWIPIIGVFGEEKYIRQDGSSKRIFMSLIRRARPAQHMLAFVASQWAEDLSMAPRAPRQGYKGQFDSTQHKNLHKVPVAYAEFLIPKDWSAQWGPPPLPTQPQYTSNSEAFRAAYDQWRMNIQASMGNAPLPTAAQRQNEKSGIALEKIQDEQAVGWFHITDNTVRALGNAGTQVNELITKLAELDSLPSHLLGKDQKGEDVQIPVASSKDKRNPESEHLDEADQFFAHEGQFEVTVSDGPNYRSEREEASSFADTMLEMLPKMGLPPQITQELLSIAVKLKNIGSYGDEIADLLSPPDPNKLTPQAKAILAQAQGQVQQLQQQVQVLMLEKLGKVTETKGKMALQEQEHGFTLTEGDKDRETKLAIAEVMTKAQNLNERIAAVEDLMKQFHDQAHDVAMANVTHAQAKELADKQAAAQSAQSSQEAGQQSAQSAQDHVQTSAQQAQAEPSA